MSATLAPERQARRQSVVRDRTKTPIDERTASRIAVKIWQHINSPIIAPLRIRGTADVLEKAKQLQTLALRLVSEMKKYHLVNTFVPNSIREVHTLLGTEPPTEAIGLHASRANIIVEITRIASSANILASGISSNANTYHAQETNHASEIAIRLRGNISATVSVLKDELIGLNKVFDKVWFDATVGTVCATTEPIIIRGINFGPFTIQLAITTLAHLSSVTPYKVIAVNPVYVPGSVNITHPHVKDGYLCEGDAREVLHKLWADGRICEAFIMIRQTLRNYNSGSPHLSIEKWIESREARRHMLLQQQDALARLSARARATGALTVNLQLPAIPSNPVLPPGLRMRATSSDATSGFAEPESAVTVQLDPSLPRPDPNLYIFGRPTSIQVERCPGCKRYFLESDITSCSDCSQRRCLTCRGDTQSARCSRCDAAYAAREVTASVNETATSLDGTNHGPQEEQTQTREGL